MTEQNNEPEKIRLTQYSRGAGCGCKIAPSVLQEMLKSNTPISHNKNLLVGNDTNDDAAVLDIGDGKAIISTTDFFMPIVDDAFDFGSIAAANAISDVYAMGGTPLMAVAILGWPIEKIPTSIAQQVLEGARSICAQANIPLAGGHTIDTIEPMFGLAVTGMVETAKIKKNNTASIGDYLFITKPIGLGILSTAQKRDVIAPEHAVEMIRYMTQLNSIGALLAGVSGVTAMTDVTGFGLLGHCIEMAEGAELSIELFYSKIPVVSGAKEYLSKRIVPDATYRNWNSYSTKTAFEKGVNVMEAFNLLPDPQTNGGMLFSVHENNIEEVTLLLKANGYEDFITPIGRFTEVKEKAILVSEG
jgi:selenide,water dikinase